MTWTVGQKAILVRDEHYHRNQRQAPVEITITKIGLKWIYTNRRNERFDKDTGWVDSGGCSYSSKVYRDLAHWQEENDRAKAIRAFYNAVCSHQRYRLEQCLTEAQIRAAVAALGIEDLFADFLSRT